MKISHKYIGARDLCVSTVLKKYKYANVTKRVVYTLAVSRIPDVHLGSKTKLS